MLSRLRTALRRFCVDRAANVAMIFAIASVPVVGFIGAGYDYSHANAVKANLQAALDSTALMIARDAASLSSAALTTKARAYFDAMYVRTDSPVTAFGATYSAVGGSSVEVTGTASVPTTFLRVLGPTALQNINVSGSSTTKWGSTRLRVALVLDTTGSMNSDGKITALKTATKGLLSQLESAAGQNGDVYVSIIPFSKNVNVGSSNYGASWIDWTEWEAPPPTVSNDIRNNQSAWEQVNGGDDCPFDNSNYGFVCAPNPSSTSTTNNVPSSGTYAGYICPSTNTGRQDSTKIGIMHNGCYTSVQQTRTISSGWSASCGSTVNCSCSGSGSSKSCRQTYYTHPWVTNARSTWNGCVADRGTASGPSNDYDRKVTAPGTSAASKFAAEQNSYCSPEAMGLNYNWSTMKSLVDSLYPLGATNQPIGLVWGWQSLVGGGPFTAPAKDSNYTYQEAIVLMSDGLNTLNRWYGNGSSTNTSVDRRMYDTDGSGTCANIKAAGITIYAIHVNTDGDPTSTLLRNCASSTEKFWMITSANDLVAVFNMIGTNLSKLRVAK
jgi:Flp pilus assembly protein TadG